MSTYGWLLALHVTGAFLMLGGSTVAGILNLLAWRAERPSEIAIYFGLIRRVAVPAIGIGAATTLVLGLWLVHHQHYSYGGFWVWGAVILWVAGMALGGIGGRRQREATELATRLAAEGDTSNDDLRRVLREPRGNAMSYGAGIAFVLVLVLMIWKPGA